MAFLSTAFQDEASRIRQQDQLHVAAMMLCFFRVIVAFQLWGRTWQTNHRYWLCICAGSALGQGKSLPDILLDHSYSAFSIQHQHQLTRMSQEERELDSLISTRTSSEVTPTLVQESRKSPHEDVASTMDSKVPLKSAQRPLFFSRWLSWAR